MSIQRYQLVLKGDSGLIALQPYPEGCFVEYVDHLAALESARLAGAEEMREMAAKRAEEEPELQGDMPSSVKELIKSVSLEEQLRCAVRGTKKCVATAIRSLTLPKKG